MGERLGRIARGAVPHAPAPQTRDHLLDLVRRDLEPARTARQHEALCRRAHVRPDRAREDLGQPPVALERGDVGAVGAADRPLRAEVAQRPGDEPLIVD